MAKYVIDDSTLSGIANAIRSKTGGSDPIEVSRFPEAISGIESGGSSDGYSLFLSHSIGSNGILSISIPADSPIADAINSGSWTSMSWVALSGVYDVYCGVTNTTGSTPRWTYTYLTDVSEASAISVNDSPITPQKDSAGNVILSFPLDNSTYGDAAGSYKVVFTLIP